MATYSDALLVEPNYGACTQTDERHEWLGITATVRPDRGFNLAGFK